MISSFLSVLWYLIISPAFLVSFCSSPKQHQLFLGLLIYFSFLLLAAVSSSRPFIQFCWSFCGLSQRKNWHSCQRSLLPSRLCFLIWLCFGTRWDCSQNSHSWEQWCSCYWFSVEEKMKKIKQRFNWRKENMKACLYHSTFRTYTWMRFQFNKTFFFLIE